MIRDLGPQVTRTGLPESAEIIDCAGDVLCPGLNDMRVQLREPGEEHQETIETGSLAAAAGGVTSMVALPNTDPIIDDVAGVEFIARRARETKRTKIYCYGALTRGLEGKDLVEMGLLSEFGALGFTDALHAVADAQVMRRALNYAKSFGLLVIQHPEEPRLAAGGAMNNGEPAVTGVRLCVSGRYDASDVPRRLAEPGGNAVAEARADHHGVRHSPAGQLSSRSRRRA